MRVGEAVEYDEGQSKNWRRCATRVVAKLLR
jgi:hypothetical protein